MAQNVARLGVILGIDVAEFTKGLNAAKAQLKDFASTATDIAAAGIAAMTYKALEFSDAMSDLSDATGVGIAKILQISDALEMSGGHAEDAGKVLVKFSDNIDKAAQGSKPLQDAFARVGVTLQDLSKLSTTDLFDKAVNGMAKLNDKASQTGASLALLGKGFKGTDVEGFNQLIQESTKEFDNYADAVANAADLHDKLAKKATTTGLIFTEKVLPTLNAFFDAINSKGGMAEQVFEAIKDVLLGLWYAGGLAAKAMQMVGIAWDRLTGDIDNNQMEKRLQALNDEAEAFRKKLLQIDAGVYGVKAKAGEQGANRTVTPGKDPAAERMAAMLAVAKLVSIEYQRQMSTLLQQQAIRNLIAGMTTDEARVQSAVNQVLDATSKKLDEISKKKEEAAAHSTGDKNQIQKVIDQLDKEAQEVSRLGDVYADMARKMEEAAIASQRTFSYGWNKAFNQYAEDAQNYGKVGEDSFKSFTDNIGSAIDKFVETGKLSFSSLATSIIQDLIKIQLRMMTMQGISALFGGISGLFGGATGAASSTASSGWGLKFADGGDPPVGVPSLVGEQGPELFIPRASGTIIPNNQLGNMGSTTNITNNYIDAIDTKSFEDRIYGSSRAVWSANQYASKNISNSRTRS